MSSKIQDLMQELGANLSDYEGDGITSVSPINGTSLATLRTDNAEQVKAKIERAHAAFLQWRKVPAPRRGELIRLFGDELRFHKAALGQVVTLEAGKILQEGLGEVQEMIDICDFAVGLSRQL